MTKLFCLVFVFLFGGLGFCQHTEKGVSDEKIIIITQSENRKHNLTAVFYGVDFQINDENKTAMKIIKYVVFRDNKSDAEVRYEPSGTVSAADFYFTKVWSPDEELLILPIGKFEGFGVFEAENALDNIKSKNYLDTLKVKSENSGWFWHNFEKWEDDSTFSFRAGLDGDMFAFKYDLKKSELYCYEGNCADSDIGINSKGKIRAVKKGDIAPIKMN